MPQVIRLKRSAVPGQVPAGHQLALGEMAINTYDGRVFFKKDDGTASVNEMASLSQPAAFADDVTVGGNLAVNGNSTIGDSGADTVSVNATADFNSDVNVDGTLTTTGPGVFGDAAADTQTFNGNSTFNGSLTANGAAVMNGNVTLGNAAADTITVNGTTTFSEPVNMAGGMTVPAGSNFSTSGNTTIGNDGTDTLTVNADTTFNDKVSIAGLTANEIAYVDTNGDLTGDANFTYNGTKVDVTGEMEVDNITFNGNTIGTTSGNLTINSAGTLEISDTANFAGAVTIDGNVDLGNATSDTITMTGRVDSNIVPSTNNTRDLGTSSLKFNDVFTTNVQATNVYGATYSVRTAASNPASPSTGDMYFNTTDGQFLVWSGTEWKGGGGALSGQTFGNVGSLGVGAPPLAGGVTSHSAGTSYAGSSIRFGPGTGTGTWLCLSPSTTKGTFFYNDQAYTRLDYSYPGLYERTS